MKAYVKVHGAMYLFTIIGVENLEERQLQVKIRIYSHFSALELTLKLIQILFLCTLIQ